MIKFNTFKSGIAPLGIALAALMTATSASATEGYFQNGFGARNKALAGAGVADSRDATALAINPAGIVGLMRQYNSSISLFAPIRGYSASGTAFVAPGHHKSTNNLFAIPNSAYVQPLGPDSAWGFSLSGNGGLNTTYRNVTNTSASCPGASGVFCSHGTGVDLNQALIAVGYARQFGAFKFGFSPILAAQKFRANGLKPFGGISSDASNLSDQGSSISFGGGFKVGVEFALSQAVRFGASFQSRMWMSKFGRYSGLFAQSGNFDIPANLQAGVAIDVTPDLTFMVDYKHIFYSTVKSISNSSVFGGTPLGANGGPGFGWKDIDIIKIGAEWRASERLTLRMGYSYNTSPLRGRDVTFNILAPATVQHHITGGGAYKINANNEVELALMFAPKVRVSGPEFTPGGQTPGSRIRIEMYQLEATVGWKYYFNAPPPAVVKE